MAAVAVQGRFDSLYSFYSLRHSAVERQSTGRPATCSWRSGSRGVSPLTTTIYTHPRDEDLFAQVRGLNC